MLRSHLAAITLVVASLSCITHQSGALEFTIDEELPIGTVIGNVKTQYYDIYNLQTKGKRFNLFQKSSPRDLFEVDPHSGDIRVKGRIDREALCPQETIRCRIDFSIYQDSLSHKVDVIVQINDINDCKPFWSVPGNIIRVDLLDGDGPGKHKDIPVAEDKDLGKNASIRYTLENLGAPFSLKFKRDENRLSIETSKMIDREEKASYNMTLVATDEGNPPLTGSVTIHVTIVDVNDNTPEFDKAFYAPIRPIYEDEPVNNVVLILRATDKDSGAYGTVTYDFASTTGEDQKLAMEYFAVHQDGRIVVRKPLDYDRMTKKYFYFEVIARDNARDKEYRKTATATVSISILDRVDEAPTIETCFLPSGCSANPPPPRIPEGLPMKSKIAEVTVRDRDTGDDVQCFTNSADRQPPLLIGQQPGQQQHSGQPPFKLSPSSGGYGTGPADSSAGQVTKTFDLVTNQEFDREQATQVCFEIVCRDTKHKEGNARYCVAIDDVNDSPPVVDGPIVFQAFEEDAEKRALSGRVKDYVRDADEGRNSQLRFAIDPSDHDAIRMFDINADTGQLQPLVVFDREKQDQYVVRVLVSDKGEPPLSATATVTVRVADANDRHPLFLQPEYRLHIAENRPTYTPVGTVEARDEDLREHGNGVITYRFDKLHSASGDEADWRAFTIDPRSGEIKTVTTLDREKKAHYTFRVLAEDQPKSGQVLTGTCVVSVSVDDENDNKPVFRISPEHPDVFQVTKREPGNSIGQVLAEDADEGENRVVEYELLNKAEIHDLFSVDRRSGLVLINKALHGLPARDYVLKIRACDRGRPKNCSGEMLFKAHIADRKDAALQGDGGGANGGGSNDGSGEQSGKGGFGNEIIIVCLSVMFLVLGIATVTVVCLIVRKRSVYVKKSRQPTAAMAAGADIEHADVKMISGSYDMPPAYKDFNNGEEEFCTYNTNLQLKPAGTYGYRAGGKEARYCTTSPCPAGGSSELERHHQDYQALDTGVRFTRRLPGGDAKLYSNSLHMYYEIKGGAAAAGGPPGTSALQQAFVLQDADDDVDDGGGDGLRRAGTLGRRAAGGGASTADAVAAATLPQQSSSGGGGGGHCVDSSKVGGSPSKLQHFATFSPYTEASFV